MMRTAIASAILILASFSPSHSQVISVYADQQGTDPGIIVNGPQMIDIYIIVDTGPNGAVGVDFSAPLPATSPGQLLYVSEVPFFSTTIGNSQTGISVDFGTCLYGKIPVLHIIASATDSITCAQYPVLPSQDYQWIRIHHCDQTIYNTLDPGFGYIARSEPYVYDRYPPDGASGLPLDVTLSWKEWYCEYSIFWDCLGPCFGTVYFGTDPNPPEAGLGYFSFDPGPLQPNTTYYWKIVPGYGSPTTPVWSFTTGKEVPSELSTWGKIKSLYQ